MAALKAWVAFAALFARFASAVMIVAITAQHFEVLWAWWIEAEWAWSQWLACWVLTNATCTDVYLRWRHHADALFLDPEAGRQEAERRVG